jgi:diguanylate cyclase (GGDEF)-like protein/PAS domain S-box-containing protein
VIRLEHLRGPLLAGALWSALALASVQLRDQGGAVLLLWLPSAVAVASLYATPVRRWPAMLAALLAAQLLTFGLMGIPPVAVVGFALASQIEAVICAGLGIRLLGGRSNSPQTFAHVFGLFVAALVGCAAGALIALPFRAEPSLGELAWWFLTSVLGVLTATPALLYLRKWLGFGDQTVRFWEAGRKRGFALSVAAMFALGAWVLASPVKGLLPLLLVAIVFAVIRFGQLAAAWGVIAYAAAGTLASLGGRSPAASLAHDPFTAGLLLQGQMLLMLATALPIAAMLLTRDRLTAQLREQNTEMRDNLTILRLAESLAGIGRWRYDMRSGRQHWSPLMLEMNGLPPELAPDPGNVRDLLPDGGEQLFGEIAAHRESPEPYSFEYRISPPDGRERVLKIHVSNEFGEDGERAALFAVAMDVTEQVEREQALDHARKRAIGLAAEAQKLANTDPLTELANRRATLDWLQSLAGVSGEAEDPLAVLLFDIDHFKRINDCFGHQTGDEVLKRVASIAYAQIRTEDLVGRIGGEEFVCIVSGLSDDQARGLAERLCRAIADGTESGGLPKATISVGLAHFRNGDTAAELLARADVALYEAKEAGRNQVRLAA